MCLYLIRKNIHDLNGTNTFKDVTLKLLKRDTKILIIDDGEFIFLDLLRKNGYNIEHKKDISSVLDVAAYHIIFCDVRGVGKDLSGKFEGAHLVRLIKNEYPEKMVISYSAIGYDSTYEEYLSFADGRISKGSSIEDWSSCIDEYIKKIADPKYIWENTRSRLEKEGVPTIKIAQYEDRYVRAIQSGSFENMKKLFNKSENATVIKILSDLVEFALSIVKVVN
ncbi:MAG: response regulator [Firmicutes bacterium]|nr:response regulator [Bacillota bacterium]